MRRVLLLLGIGLPLLLAAYLVGSGSIQGPVRGRVELSDAAARDDLVVRLYCTSYLIHGAGRSDEEVRRVSSGERFLFPWAYRGIYPVGCSLEVYHPLYRLEHVHVGQDFSQDLPAIRLERWDALLDEPEDLSRSDLHRHLFYLRYYYLKGFEKESARRKLARYLPALHEMYDRALNTLPRETHDRFGSNEDSLKNLKALGEALEYRRADVQEALFAAAAAGDRARVLELLDGGADADAWNAEGLAAIHLSAEEGHTETLILLLEQGADLDRRIEGLGDTALLLAMRRHRSETVLALIERGADVTYASRGTTALRLGAYNGMTPEVLRALLDAGAVSHAREARHPAEALQAAGRNGRTGIIRSLLDAGVPVDAGLPGYSALMHASARGHVKAARYLIESGADLNAVSVSGSTPLALAKENQRTELIELLREAGARD